MVNLLQIQVQQVENKVYFIVDRKSTENKQIVEFELSGVS